MRFNINDYVNVKLTDYGRQLHREDHYAFWKAAGREPPYPYRPPKEDADGWSQWQMWDLMQTFGKHISLGTKMPFETEIRIDGRYIDSEVAKTQY
jgi:hypothetical protein